MAKKANKNNMNDSKDPEGASKQIESSAFSEDEIQDNREFEPSEEEGENYEFKPREEMMKNYEFEPSEEEGENYEFKPRENGPVAQGDAERVSEPSNLELMKGVFSKIKENSKRIAAVTGITICIGGFGLSGWYLKNIGEGLYHGREVYRGLIQLENGAYNVIYKEGKFYLSLNPPALLKNEMQISKEGGDYGYIFEDTHGETKIDWPNQQTPELHKDKLERVTIYYKDKNSQEYLNPRKWGKKNRIDDMTIQGSTASRVFEKAHSLYHAVRDGIRAKLRSDYEGKHKPFLDSFGKSSSEQ